MKRLLLLASFVLAAAAGNAQSSTPQIQPLPQGTTLGKFKLDPIQQPTLSPAQLELIKLDARFSTETAKGGGPVFASWFAEDATLLNNGKPPIRGIGAIRAAAMWTPEAYRLTWQLGGAQVLPGGESGTTWGHYTASFHDASGQPKTLEGRYITVWGRRGGEWKVLLEASADDTPDAPASPIAAQP